jgi:hypothetical protein
MCEASKTHVMSSKDRAAQIRRMLRSDPDLFAAQVAQRIGITRDRVLRVCHDAGIEIRMGCPDRWGKK